MYIKPNNDSWSGRIDTNEEEAGFRWHQVIKLIDLENEQLPSLGMNGKGIVNIGFCCDEGVRRNKGRIGAVDGPDALREACSNHAVHLDENSSICDGGNVVCVDGDLEGAQQELRNLVTKIMAASYFPLVFGGGHEVAYGHFMGLHDAAPSKRIIGIINLDAHFDLRIPEPNPSSGTPFFQIAQECEQLQKPFKYLCLGIQESSNTRALFERADSLGVEYIPADQLNVHSIEDQMNKINRFIQSVDQVYFTICLDVFDISVAPGVSAPTAIGLRPEIAQYLINEILKSGKVSSTDLAELNPALDSHKMTAKLAGKLVYEIVRTYFRS